MNIWTPKSQFELGNYRVTICKTPDGRYVFGYQARVNFGSTGDWWWDENYQWQSVFREPVYRLTAAMALAVESINEVNAKGALAYDCLF